MSRAYEKLLKKLDRPVNTTTIDPQIAALQARFSAIVDSSKKDILGHHSEEEEDKDGEADYDDYDEDDEDDDMMDQDNDDGFDLQDELGLDVLDGEGEDDDQDENGYLIGGTKPSSKSKQPISTNGLELVDAEEMDEEDDEFNIFQYEWDIERDESDSELDGNDDDDDDDEKGGDNNNNKNNNKDEITETVTKRSKPNAAGAASAPSTTDASKKSLVSGPNKDKGDEINATQSLYDQYFNIELNKAQIATLEAKSAFIPPQSDTIGLTLREEVDESDLVKQMRYNNKYNPYGKNNNNQNSETTLVLPPRVSAMANNTILRTGTLLDQYNLSSAQFQYPDLDCNEDEYEIEYELEHLTSNQIGAQQLQIFSDRSSLSLSPLPTLPQSDSKYPVDQYGDGLVVTAGKQRGLIQKSEDNGTWRKSGYTKAQLQKMKASSDVVPKMAVKRPTPSFKSFGYKQRLAQHLTDMGLVTPTAYNIMRESYISYSSDQTQYQFITSRMLEIEKTAVTTLSKDHGLLLPSYQHDTQSLFASFLSTYTDCFISPPIPAPNQQIDWFIYRDVYLIHIINHILIHRDRLISHNEALYRRDARKKEESFIRELSKIRDASQRFKMLEAHLDELGKIMEDTTKTPLEQQDAQARLAVLTHSHKTRVHIKRLQDQYEKDKLTKVDEARNLAMGDVQPKDNKNNKNNNNNNNNDGEDGIQLFSRSQKKLTAKQQERLVIQQRQAADLEFQHKMSTLKLTKAKAQLRRLDGGDSEVQPNLSDDPFSSPTSALSSTSSSQDKYRDQGFTRPTVLILSPSKLHAYTIISRLLELLPPQQSKRMVNVERLHAEFGDSLGEYTAVNNKPLDYNLNFNGNNDDSFYMGIQFNGNGLKLFSSLYSSDLIIASPLGLKLIVGNDGMNPHERKADFLSSIEISVVDQLQLLSHQNVDHLIDVFKVINGFPSKTTDIDFSRIKPGFLNGHGRFHRQNIWLSGMLTPQLLFLYNRYCENKNGLLRLRPVEYHAVSSYFKLPPGTLKQTFYRVDLSGASAITNNANKSKQQTETVFDKKISLWFNDVWPRIKDWYQTEGSTVIFVPSSYDFIRIRNAFEEKFVDYLICGEYTDQRSIDSHRTRIAHGTAKFLLVSERFWVFNRSSFYGIKHVVWYGLPTIPQVYIDFINYIKPSSVGVSGSGKYNNKTNNGATTLQSSSIKNLSTGNSSSMVKNISTSITAAKQPTSFVLYSAQDAMALERIIGTEFARELLLSAENIHVIQ